jgi:hypothetical protein
MSLAPRSLCRGTWRMVVPAAKQSLKCQPRQRRRGPERSARNLPLDPFQIVLHLPPPSWASAACPASFVGVCLSLSHIFVDRHSVSLTRFHSNIHIVRTLQLRILSTADVLFPIVAVLRHFHFPSIPRSHSLSRASSTTHFQYHQSLAVSADVDSHNQHPPTHITDHFRT